MRLLVHGIVEAGSAGPLASLVTGRGGSHPGSGEELRTVVHHELAALVTQTETDEVVPSRANLLHHTDVLRTVGERVTVVPMRFGVVVPDADALIGDYLAPEHDRLVATLQRLRAHVELRLRGRYDEPTVIDAVLAADPHAARLRGREGFDAKLQLGERIVAGIARRRQADVDRVVETLRPHVTDVAPSAVTGPLEAFLLSFLVGEAERASFEARVEALGREFAPLMTLELAGPIPPFSFAAGRADAWV